MMNGLITRSQAFTTNGSTYARAWAVTAYLYFSGLPVSFYVKAFHERGPSAIALFKACFLLPHETLDDFSTSCIHWVLFRKKASPSP